jgi:AbrB family looped-hinge helix DNA binding protein
METEQTLIYHVKVDSSGRIVLPSEVRERHRIATGDTLVAVEEKFGLRLKTRAEVIAEAQAYYTQIAPRDVLLSEELLQDRRAEHERD